MFDIVTTFDVCVTKSPNEFALKSSIKYQNEIRSGSISGQKSKKSLKSTKKLKKLKKVEKIKKIFFRKFQNMMRQNNDLKKTLIKSNKATKN